MSKEEIGQKPAYSVYEERDTYRELCAYLVKEMESAKYYISSTCVQLEIQDAITKAKSILGDK